MSNKQRRRKLSDSDELLSALAINQARRETLMKFDRIEPNLELSLDQLRSMFKEKVRPILAADAGPNQQYAVHIGC